MNKRMLLATAAFTLTAGMAMAQSVAEQVVSQLQSQGFTRIEVKQGPTQVKVEAIRGNTEVEFIYDTTTGALLSREVGTVDSDDDRTPGVEFDREDEDFIGDDDNDDENDDEDDDENDDDDEDDRDDDRDDDENDDEDDDEDDDENDDEDDDENDDEDDDEGDDDEDDN